MMYKNILGSYCLKKYYVTNFNDFNMSQENVFYIITTKKASERCSCSVRKLQQKE